MDFIKNAMTIQNSKKTEFLYCVLGSVWGPHDLNNGGFIIQYGIKNSGFGEVTFKIKKDGSLVCDNENCSREFVNQVLSELTKQARFVDETEKHLVLEDKILHGQRDNIFNQPGKVKWAPHQYLTENNVDLRGTIGWLLLSAQNNELIYRVKKGEQETKDYKLNADTKFAITDETAVINKEDKTINIKLRNINSNISFVAKDLNCIYKSIDKDNNVILEIGGQDFILHHPDMLIEIIEGSGRDIA